jgi:hypothetical protein
VKFNFTVDINDYEYASDLQDEILDRATHAFMSDVLGSSYDKDSISSKLEHKINKKIDEIMNKEFREMISDKVLTGLASKFEKSKQYKELLKGSEIESDVAIKTGLRDIVRELVKSEMKNMFK